jgi:hypothetical protein
MACVTSVRGKNVKTATLPFWHFRAAFDFETRSLANASAGRTHLGGLHFFAGGLRAKGGERHF